MSCPYEFNCAGQTSIIEGGGKTKDGKRLYVVQCLAGRAGCHGPSLEEITAIDTAAGSKTPPRPIPTFQDGSARVGGKWDVLQGIQKNAKAIEGYF